MKISFKVECGELLSGVHHISGEFADYDVVDVVHNARQRNISAIRSMRSVAKDCLKMLSSSLYSIIVNAPHCRARGLYNNKRQRAKDSPTTAQCDAAATVVAVAVVETAL